MKKKKMDSTNKIKAILGLIIWIAVIGFFAYAGYVYCKDNNGNVMKGIVFGILFPFIILILDQKESFGFIAFIIITFLYIMICSYIPLFVGVIAMPFVIGYFIRSVLDECKDDIEKFDKNITDKNQIQYKNTYTSNNYEIENNNSFISEEEYYCERCFKKISEEEYEMNDCMCEDCYEDVVVNHQDDIFK